MDTHQLTQFLDDRESAESWLRSLGIVNLERAHSNLVGMTTAGLTLDLLREIGNQLAACLPRTSDPDMALNNLDAFISSARNPLAVGSLLERDREALPVLMQIFSTSQYLSDQLIRDPESFDLLRITDGQPVSRQILVDEMCTEIESAHDENSVSRLLRRYKHRETLRIAYGDIIHHQRIDIVTRQISFLADAICEAAIRAAHRKLEESRGVPRRADGQRARIVAIGMGKLGGVELNYSSDIDLVFLSDDNGKTDGRRSITNQEYFDRLVQHVVRLLSENTELGSAYRVDLRLRPEGRQGPAVQGVDSALRYYDVSGRTWERQAYVKARPVAGDLELGQTFLEQLQPWIYRRYLSRADITGIKALKRRIEKRASREGGDVRNVKTGCGGIRDIEFVIQFLQLLNGGDLFSIRTGNTLDAIARLENAGCLTMQERSILEKNYAFLRKLEHRLQIMFDLQTHELPVSDEEMGKLAIRMGFEDTETASALESFRSELATKTNLNRQILDHLLHSAFPDREETQPEVDLVLDPNPTPESVREVMSRHGFADVDSAYQNMLALSRERIPFLSTRRCRHFLAAIAPRLLSSIATTPDPDSTLVNLSKVSDSLGGKGVLWELFSFNPPTLQLYVRLCATSPYLCSILTSSPGMIDELMDSLVLNKLPTLESLDALLTELSRGAEDTEPILHSFKKFQHLRVGVRDILGKEDIRTTHAALSDVAEACLEQITTREFDKLTRKHGVPTIAEGDSKGEPSEFTILAMGKLGGREPNYHSDLDIVFLFEDVGMTQPLNSRKDECTTNQHFFSQLGQRIIKVVNQLGPYGRLYDLDPRLRPTGKSGSLAVPLPELLRYFESGQGQLWERQALCKARAVYGTPAIRSRTLELVHEIIKLKPWSPENADAIRDMRFRLQETASKKNLKRGPGGTVDIEFLVQMLQLKHARPCPQVLLPGTLDAIAALRDEGILSADDAQYLDESYRFLRSVEARLRLMNTTARHDFPSAPDELNKLAYLLGDEGPEALARRCSDYTHQNRQRFLRLFAENGTS